MMISGKRVEPILIAGIILLMGACTAEMPQAPIEDNGELVLSVKAELPQTRTYIQDEGGISSFRFKEGDSIGFFAEDILTNKAFICKDANVGAFESFIKIENENQRRYRSSVMYYAYSPYYAEAGTDPANLYVVLPSNQSAPFDGDADYMVATAIEQYYELPHFPDLSFSFSNHLFAIVKLSVTNTSEELSDELILNMGLRSSCTALAGGFSFDATEPERAPVIDMEHKTNRVKVQYSESEQPLLGIGLTHSVYAVVCADTFTAGSLELVVETSNYRFYVPTKMDVTLSRNQVTSLPVVNLSDESKVSVTSDRLTSFSLDIGGHSYDAFDISESVVSIQVPNASISKGSSQTAFFTTKSPEARVFVNSTLQTSGSNSHDFGDFSKPVMYNVEGEDGESREYEIRLFDLPVILIDTPTPIVHNKVWVDDCAVSIIGLDGVKKDYGNAVQVKGRGNSTWTWPKKPYTFKLSSKENVLGMPADKRWNLLANYDDRTMIRNDVSLELGRRADGLDWTSHGEFVELIMNGEYVGTYYLCEHNKVASARVNIREMKVKDTDPVNITGGYLLEYDAFKDRPFFVSATAKYPVSIKSPDDDGFDVQWAWIESYVNNLEKVLSNSDSLAAHKYLKYMDIDSYVDWWLVYEITGNGYEPSAPRSCYMYKDRGGKMHAGPVWDFDQFTYRNSISGFQLKNVLYYKYLFKDPLFVARVKERWPILKSNLSGMPDYIDAAILKVANAIKRDKTVLWPTGYNDSNGDNRLSIDAANARLKSVYQSRILELDGLISALVATPSDKGTGNEDFNGQTTPDFGFGF